MLSRPGRWLVLLRAVLVVVGAIAVSLTSFPPSYTPWAWAVVGFFAAVTVFSGVLSVVGQVGDLIALGFKQRVERAGEIGEQLHGRRC